MLWNLMILGLEENDTLFFLQILINSARVSREGYHHQKEKKKCAMGRQRTLEG